MKQLSWHETWGKYGNVKLAITGELPETITDEEILNIVYGVLEKINDQIHDIVMSKDTTLLKSMENEETKLKSLFGSELMYCKQIPNQYCSIGSYKFRKWLEVTTRKGIITIGWRKRVINIDWSKSGIPSKADELFPGEDVTKSDKYIHAWGYEAAQNYIDKLLEV